MNQNQGYSKIPYVFFIFFAVVIAVNVFFVYISKQSWRGVVTEDAYQKGINYNKTIEQVKKQEELGWQVKVRYEGAKNGVMMINVFDRKGKVINDANIYVEFRRPTQEGYDFAQAIPMSGGIYISKINFPLLGQWEAQIVVNRNGEVFQEVKRYVIQ